MAARCRRAPKESLGARQAQEGVDRRRRGPEGHDLVGVHRGDTGIGGGPTWRIPSGSGAGDAGGHSSHTRVAACMLSACAPYTQEDSHRLAHEHADLAIASGTHVDMQTHAVTTGMHACPHIGMRPHMYTCPFACVHTRSWGVGVISLRTRRRPSSSS